MGGRFPKKSKMIMKKTKLLFPLILMLVVTMMALVACGETTAPTPSGPYSVKFVVDGVVEKTATIESKADINGYFTPEKEGYNFEGWYLDKGFEKPLASEENPQTNLALYAKMSKKSFVVKFMANGQVVESVTVLYGEVATAPTPPEAPSMVFEKWDTDFSEVKSDLVVNAIYTEQVKFSATFLLNGKEIYKQSFNAGDKTEKLAKSALDALDIPDGFEFLSWATLLDKPIPDTFPERSVEYKAVLGISDVDGEISTTFSGDGVEYTPDELTFTANHTAFDGIEYRYQWFIDGNPIGNQKEITIDTPDVGNHKIKTIITASSEWADSVSKSVSFDFAVDPATITTPSIVNNWFEYDGKPHDIEIDILPGDKLEYRLADGQWTSSLNLVNAGDYEIYFRLTRKNYHIYESSTPLVLSIAKKVVGGTIVTKTISYGDDLPTTYKVNYMGFVGTDDASVFSGDIIFTASVKDSLSIGNHTVSGDTTNHTADNYTLDLADGCLEITKRVLVVTADSKNIVVGDALPTLTISYTGFAPGENVDSLDKAPTIYCAYVQGGIAGKYAITVSDAESEHYHFVYKEGTLTVSRS